MLAIQGTNGFHKVFSYKEHEDMKRAKAALKELKEEFRSKYPDWVLHDWEFSFSIEGPLTSDFFHFHIVKAH